MKWKRSHWMLAIGASCVIHAGAAALIEPPKEEVRVESGGSGVIVLGNNVFADMSAMGEESEIVEPETEIPAAIVPPEPTVTAPEPAEPSSADTIVPVETTEPLGPEEEVAMLPIPRPTPRPHYTPPKVEPRQGQPPRQAPSPRQQTEERKESPKRQATSRGSRGQNTQNARRGSSEGSRVASGTESQGPGRARQTGNAATSNYPGKIVAKLRRSLRYPREARRQRLGGEVRVAFTVTQDGRVSGIRIVRSSGSPVLDQAALETVQRAAPFPKIPAEAARSSWPFTVPLEFKR